MCLGTLDGGFPILLSDSILTSQFLNEKSICSHFDRNSSDRFFCHEDSMAIGEF